MVNNNALIGAISAPHMQTGDQPLVPHCRWRAFDRSCEMAASLLSILQDSVAVICSAGLGGLLVSALDRSWVTLTSLAPSPRTIASIHRLSVALLKLLSATIWQNLTWKFLGAPQCAPGILAQMLVTLLPPSRLRHRRKPTRSTLIIL